MNAIVPAQPQMVEHQQSYGLVPATMGEAMQLANMMAGAKLVPAALQKSPADCLMVIQQAVRWQMDPFAVAQECSVIQGRLMHSGKLVAAVINARGNLAARLSFDYAGAGDARTITVSGRLHGEAEARTVQVQLKDAKTANRVWQTQPDQQLMYHGSRVWARRHTPELMLGVYSPEEFDELTTERRTPRAAPNVMLPLELHDATTGEIIDNEASPQTLSAAVEVPPSPGLVRGQDEGGPIQDSDAVAEWDRTLATAAAGGSAALRETWAQIPVDIKPTLKSALDRRHKKTAAEADAAQAPA